MPRIVRRTGSDSPRKKDDCRYVVPEISIRDFVGSLDILDITTHAARFQAIAELTSNAFENKTDSLDQSGLRLIEQIANEDDSEQFRLIMKAIRGGVREGRYGINSAHLTASRVVELAFRWTREYFSALRAFKQELSGQRLRLVKRPPRRRVNRQ